MEKLIVEGVDLTEFLGISYVASRHLGNISVDEFLANPQLGANCELLVLGALKKAGFCIGEEIKIGQDRIGSMELWRDEKFTCDVFPPGDFRAFDIMFCLPHIKNRTHTKNLVNAIDLNDYDPRRMHLGLCLGRVNRYDSQHCVLHNTRPGPSEICTFRNFTYFVVKFKRPIKRLRDDILKLS